MKGRVIPANTLNPRLALTPLGFRVYTPVKFKYLVKLPKNAHTIVVVIDSAK